MPSSVLKKSIANADSFRCNPPTTARASSSPSRDRQCDSPNGDARKPAESGNIVATGSSHSDNSLYESGISGAGYGNRTRLAGLGSQSITTMLSPLDSDSIAAAQRSPSVRSKNAAAA